MPGAAWAWFAAWMVVGSISALVAISIASIGLLLAPLALLGMLVLFIREDSRASVSGFISGLGLPLLWVAWLNLGGPGQWEERTATSVSGGELLNPWPWLMAGLLLIGIGFAGQILARLRRRPAHVPVNYPPHISSVALTLGPYQLSEPEFRPGTAAGPGSETSSHSSTMVNPAAERHSGARWLPLRDEESSADWQKETRPTRGRVGTTNVARKAGRVGILWSAPLRWTCVTSNSVWHLMCANVLASESSPPVPAHSLFSITEQNRVVASGVDHSNRNSLSKVFDRIPQVGIIRYDDHRIDTCLVYINQHVRRDIHI